MKGGRLDPALERARGFVEAHGEPLDALFLQVVLGAHPPAALAEALAAVQDAAGALAGLAPGGVASTARGLELLDAVALLEHPVAERAVQSLCAARLADGSWNAAGDPACGGELACTAQVAGLLGRSPFAPGSVLHDAERWLAGRWSRELVQGPSYEPVLAYFRALASLPSELADEALQWCGRELERGHRSGAFEPVATARVFLRCGARALPGAGLRAGEVAAAVRAAQDPDGGFPGGCLRARVEATLDAALALARLSD